MKKIQWKKNAKYSKLLVILLFVPVLMIGIYIGIELQSMRSDSSYSATQKEKFDSVYKNEKFGFEFIRPVGSEISSTDYEGDEYVSKNTTNIYLGSSANAPINVYLKGAFAAPKETDIQSDPRSKELTINGKKAYRIEDYGTSNNWFIVTVFFSDKYVYEIQFSNDSKDQKYIDMQDKLVNSFKFN